MWYCNTKTSRNGVNNMWILKNSTSLLSSLSQLDVRAAASVQTFDSSTLYTSILHNLLKSRISKLVHNTFRRKYGSVQDISISIEFLIYNILVQFGGCLFRQVIGIPMPTNCVSLLADLFLCSYVNEFLNNMFRRGHRRLARSSNLCYRYIDDSIVFNNKRYIHPS